MRITACLSRFRTYTWDEIECNLHGNITDTDCYIGVEHSDSAVVEQFVLSEQFCSFSSESHL